MDFRIVIPARYHSTRLPHKLLREIAGKPLLQYAYEQALASGARSVVIATDHANIMEAAKSWGAQVCMTDVAHQSGTDRLAEVAALLGYADDEIIVNVQGDEPLLPPALIEQVAKNLHDYSAASVSTLGEKIEESALLFNPNVVKVVFDQAGYALYFSRAPIAWCRDEFAEQAAHTLPLPTNISHYRHIGLYAYRVGFLKNYSQLKLCELENAEKLEQLRVLWHGYKIHVALAAEAHPPGVDTLEDLQRVAQFLKHA